MRGAIGLERLRLITIIIGICVVAAAYFVYKSALNTSCCESHKESDVKVQSTPIALIADEENQGKRCEVKLYDGDYDPEENSPEYKRCSKLQKELNQAAWNGDVDGIRKTLERGSNVNAGYYNEGGPLSVAVIKGRTEAVQLLIDNGAEVDVVYNFGMTPLKQAASYNFVDIARILIENGADVCSDLPDDFGKRNSALDIAKMEKHLEMIKLLKSAGAGQCPGARIWWIW